MSPYQDSPTLDVLTSYDSLDTPMAELEPAQPSVEGGSNAIRQPIPFRTNIQRQSTMASSTSSSNLVPPHNARQRHTKFPSRSSPFYWNLPSHVTALEEKRARAIKRKPERPSKWYHGWKVILFGSWLNVLLVVIPVSWVLHATMEDSHMLDFVFTSLAMIPLVKMHDLATQDLALRIGGSKTGLLNASLSNTVELVVAITALRKCELKVVQSSLIGSILSKLLLVLGMCFFAGGLRFSEQDFNASATQIHSSLLSISVGALLLPAAYHFALTGSNEESATAQKKAILRMSHGVSIVLLFIYGGYIVFQLYSHSHFYEDSKVSSEKLSTVLKERANGERRHATAESQSRTSTPRKSPYMNSHYTTASDVTLSFPDATSPQSKANSTEWSKVNLIDTSHSTDAQPHHDRNDSGASAASTSTFQGDNAGLNRVQTQDLSEPPSPIEEEEKLHPRLSWTMTLLLLTAVTIMVSFNAEWLVESLDTISTTISKEWIALIMLPAISSIAECATAVNVSVKDQLTLSVSVAVSSSIQTALFVIPFMVTLAWSMGKPLSLLFDPFESVVLYISVHTMNYVVADGKSNWLEGMILACLYVIIAVAFWFYPGSEFSSHLSHCS